MDSPLRAYKDTFAIRLTGAAGRAFHVRAQELLRELDRATGNQPQTRNDRLAVGKDSDVPDALNVAKLERQLRKPVFAVIFPRLFPISGVNALDPVRGPTFRGPTSDYFRMARNSGC